MASKLQTNFNQPPYYNDYDEADKYHRVLFRPGVALQARELSELQDILQDQVARHGDFTFKDGSIIQGCAFTFDIVSYVKFPDLNQAGLELNISTITGANNVIAYNPQRQISALVVDGVEGLQSQNPDLKTLYVKYRTAAGGPTDTSKTFASADQIFFINGDATTANITLASACSSIDDTMQVFQKTTGARGNVTVQNTTFITITVTNGYFANGYQLDFANSTATVSNVVISSIDSNYHIETASVASNATFGVVTNSKTNTTGNAFRMIVGDGVVFQKGHFVKVDSQSKIVEKYSRTVADAQVGFNTLESLINSNSVSALLDTASGFNNENAPGADRLKLSPSLVVLTEAEASANANFYPLVGWKNGIRVLNNNDPQLNRLGNQLAKRTREESGDYVVDNFTFSTRDYINTSNASFSNSDLLQLLVSPGIAYVDGFRVQSYDTRILNVRKATDTASLNNQSLFTNYQQAVYINDYKGHFNFNAGQEINLHNTTADVFSANTDVDDGLTGFNVDGATIIGTARVRSVEYVSGIAGTPSGVYKLNVFNISMNEGQTFNSVVSVSQGSPSPGSYNAFGDIVADSNGKKLRGSTQGGLVFNTNIEGVNIVSDSSKIVRTHGTIIIPNPGGTATLSVSNSDILPYGSGDPSPARNDFIIIPDASFRNTTNLSGTLTVNGTSNTEVSGGGTNFTTELTEGQYIHVDTVDEIVRVEQIINDASIIVSPALTSPGGASFQIAYPKDVPIDLQAFNNIDVTVGNNSNTVSFAFGSTNVQVNATISYNKKITNAVAKTKTINKNKWVTIDLTANGRTGPWNLGVADIHKITGVYESSTATNASVGTNRLAKYVLDNGQNKDYYGLGRLLKKSSSQDDLTGVNYLLVELEYFQHGAGDYLSVDSYQIDDVTTSLPIDKIRTEDIPVFYSQTGNRFDLRNCIDFRPIVDNTVTPGASSSTSTTVTVFTETFPTADQSFPAPNERFDFDVEYYLPRKDILALDSSGRMKIHEGIADLKPVITSIPSGELAIAEINIPVYPSLDSITAKNVGRDDYLVNIKGKQIKRYTMQDIGQLDQRIRSLEYYSSLNALERGAKETIIPSESNNAIERFKNGIFVDGFVDLSKTDVNSEELRMVPNNPTVSALSPNIKTFVIETRVSNTASSGISNKDYITLDFSEEVLYEVPLASRTRNLIEDVYHWEGSVRAFPNFDSYYDTTVEPNTITLDGSPITTSIIELLQAEGLALTQSADEVLDSVLIAGTESSSTSGNWRITTQEQEVTLQTVTSSVESVDNQTLIPVGDYVRDSKLQPYIRSKTIIIRVTGITPGMFHRVYFDDTDVTQYCVPVRMENAPDGQYINYDTMDQYLTDTWEDNLDKFTRIGSLGTYQDVFELSSGESRPAGFEADKDGSLLLFFEIPANTFIVGGHKITVSDSVLYGGIGSSISIAYGDYNAYNFKVQKDALVIAANMPEVLRVTNSSDPWVETQRVEIGRVWEFNDDGFGGPNGDDGSTSDTDTGDTGTGGCIPLVQTIYTSYELTEGQDGIYATGLDLYFASKDDTGGVYVYVVTCGDQGIPTNEIVPNSLSVVHASNINIGNTPTRFEFKSPIYMRANMEYAVIIHPMNGSPKYQCYTYEVGKPDAFDSTKVENAKRNLGYMFISTNERQFKPINNENVKITWYKANFGSNQTGTVVTENKDYEFFNLSNISGSGFQVGEQVVQLGSTSSGTATISSKKLYVNGISLVTMIGRFLDGQQTNDYFGNSIETYYDTDGNGSVTVTDQINLLKLSVGIITVSDLDADFVKYLREHYYVNDIDGLKGDYVYGTSTSWASAQPGESITFQHADGSKQQNYVVNAVNNTVIEVRNGWTIQDANNDYGVFTGTYYIGPSGGVSATVVSYNDTSNTLICLDSQATNTSFVFANSSTITGMSSGTTATIDVVNKQVSYLQQPIQKAIVPTTAIRATISSYDNDSNALVTESFAFGKNKYSTRDYVIKSRSNEIRDDVGAKSLKVTYTLSNSNDYYGSPMISKSSLGVQAYSYEYQSSVSGETGREGTSSNKYISRVVELRDGLDAEDIRIYMDAYRPANTSIEVYARILSDTDNAEFIDRDWTLLQYIDNTSQLRSSSVDRYDIKEFQLSFNTEPPSTTALLSGTVQSGNAEIAYDNANNEFESGDVILINDGADDDYFVSTVTAANDTILTVANEFTYGTDGDKKIRIASQPRAAFKYAKNEGIVRYYDVSGVPHDSYKKFAIKIVLKSDQHYRVPRVENIRAIAVSV